MRRDDELQGESNSIKHQKQLLESYPHKNDCSPIRHFTDDGVNETTFEREGFQAMFAELDSEKGIELIECVRQGLGKPNIIYVKNFMDDAFLYD